jgi:hypothetical protein
VEVERQVDEGRRKKRYNKTGKITRRIDGRNRVSGLVSAGRYKAEQGRHALVTEQETHGKVLGGMQAYKNRCETQMLCTQGDPLNAYLSEGKVMNAD